VAALIFLLLWRISFVIKMLDLNSDICLQIMRNQTTILEGMTILITKRLKEIKESEND